MAKNKEKDEVRFVLEYIISRYGAGFERFDDEMRRDIIAGIVAQRAIGSAPQDPICVVMARQIKNSTVE